MDAVRLWARLSGQPQKHTKERDSLGCAKLVIFCNAPDDNPVYGGRVPWRDRSRMQVINVGVSGPGVVKTALEKVRGERTLKSSLWRRL